MGKTMSVTHFRELQTVSQRYGQENTLTESRDVNSTLYIPHMEQKALDKETRRTVEVQLRQEASTNSNLK